MRRLAGISALVAVLLCAPVLAQRRGGGGFRTGFGSRGGIVFRGSYRSGGIRIRTDPWYFHRHGHFRRWWGYGYPAYYGYYGGYYDPLLWGSASSAYGTSSYDPSSASNAYYEQTQQLQQQIDRLQDEVDRLHEQQYARPAPPDVPRPPSAPATAAKPEPATFTVLIFKDQHREEVKNYAVV